MPPLSPGASPEHARPVTPATELLLACWAILTLGEQEELYARISEARLRRIAGTDSEFAQMVRALQRVADEIGGEPTVDDYRDTQKSLNQQGEQLPPISAVIRRFGSWRRAKEALNLSATNTPTKIEARCRAHAFPLGGRR